MANKGHLCRARIGLCRIIIGQGVDIGANTPGFSKEPSLSNGDCSGGARSVVHAGRPQAIAGSEAN